MGEQRIVIRRDYEEKGGATVQNRAKYVVASEKAKDLRNDHKAAKDIIKQARMAEKDALASIKANYQALSDSIWQLQASVEKYSQSVPDAVLGEQQKFKTMARNMETLIDRNMISEINDKEECSACGHELLDRTDRWQFCPVCGQRFRDTWHETGEADGAKDR